MSRSTLVNSTLTLNSTLLTHLVVYVELVHVALVDDEAEYSGRYVDVNALELTRLLRGKGSGIG